MVSSSVQVILSCDWRPAIASSSGARNEEHLGSTLDRNLYAPMNERRPFTVSGLVHDDNVLMRCWLAVRVPALQCHPRMVVDMGPMVVLWADKCKPAECKAVRMLCPFVASSSMVLPPQYRSSAILATEPSCRRSPSTLHMSSSILGQFRTQACPWLI